MTDGTESNISPPGVETEHPQDPAQQPPLFEGRYQLAAPLGQGGMCTVYRAWDTRLHRNVAIKRLEPPLSQDPQARARFHHEGKAIARLSHPNLVTLIDRGTSGDEEYLVFECVEGRSLKEIIKETAPMEPGEAGQTIGQVAEGLAHAHLAGIVHRDVKPQNILVDGEGRAKLTDFGIATGLDWTKVTREGAIVGSTRYMSPEQVQSRPVDLRSDIYSLGIVFYEMLAGTPPFDGATITDIGRQHLRTRPQSLLDLRPDIPEALDRAVMRCLEKLPEARFQSMEEFLGALVGLDLYVLASTGGGLMDNLRRAGRVWGEGLAGGSVLPLPEVELTPSERRAELMERRRRQTRRRLNRLWLVLGAVLVIAAVALAVVFAGGSSAAPGVVGLPVATASSTIEAAGLKAEVSGDVPDTKRAAGTVIAQAPAQNQHPSDGIVRLTVTRKPLPVKVTSIKDSDPQGNKKENPDLVKRATDGREDTSWTTETYDTATFSGSKDGVGLVFQLAEAATMVEVVSPDEGWAGEVQVAGDDGTYVTVADLRGVHRQVVNLPDPIKAGRIWITRLAPSGGAKYSTGIAELRFYR